MFVVNTQILNRYPGLFLNLFRCLFSQVPVGLSNVTICLFLDKNLLNSLPADSFSDLFLLDELDLSHNQVLNKHISSVL